MGKFSLSYATVVNEPEYKTVGKNNTPLCTFRIVDEKRYKDGGEWKTRNKSFWDAQVWGDSALEAATLKKGDVIDISAKDGDFRAEINQDTWEGKDGQTRSKPVITIWSWEKREFDKS